MNHDLDAALDRVRERFERFGPDDEGKARLLAHLRNVARMDEEPLDYDQDHCAPFPDRLPVAFAVCHPECGRAEFIVEGSTQACQRCGGLMFRNETAWYARVDERTRT